MIGALVAALYVSEGYASTILLRIASKIMKIQNVLWGWLARFVTYITVFISFSFLFFFTLAFVGCFPFSGFKRCVT